MVFGDDIAVKLLAEARCRDMIKDHPVIEIDSKTPIAKACSVFFMSPFLSRYLYIILRLS